MVSKTEVAVALDHVSTCGMNREIRPHAKPEGKGTRDAENKSGPGCFS